jgi:glycosyltransferase involved in cell wall biosynthesis
MKQNKPLKIIFDASPLLVNRTGVAYYTERIMTQMAKQYPNDVELVGFYYNFLGRKSTAHFPKLPNLTFRAISLLPAKIIYQLRRFGIEFPIEFLARTSGDFVLYPNFLSYPSATHMPSAPVIHDLTYLDLPDYVAAKNRSDLTRFVPVAIKRGSFVVTVSEFSKQKICTHYNVPAEQVLVTPIPPADPVLHDEITRQQTLVKLGITKPFLLFLGTIEPRKNILQLIAAYQQLAPELRDKYQLVIAGRIGWNCEAEEAKLRELQGSSVIHIGYVEEPVKEMLYQSADYFVHASHYEGFGMPLLEAMSYGAPCIVSDIPVFREVAGDNATYFNQDSVADIVQKITDALLHPERRPAASAASKTQAAKLQWSTVAGTLYEQIRKATQRV